MEPVLLTQKKVFEAIAAGRTLQQCPGKRGDYMLTREELSNLEDKNVDTEDRYP